jgi:hypothetical protein
VNYLVRRIRFHRNRSERFKEHASITESREGRRRYLRLAAQELGLAARLEAQARMEGEVQDSIPVAEED